VNRISSWEPADEFCNNFLSVYKTKNKLFKKLEKINRKSKLLHSLVMLAQKSWWRKGKGGLLEIYAFNATNEQR
jgi:hypothetical protein